MSTIAEEIAERRLYKIENIAVELNKLANGGELMIESNGHLFFADEAKFRNNKIYISVYTDDF